MGVATSYLLYLKSLKIIDHQVLLRLVVISFAKK
jgi:hypothetical protein